MGRQFPFLSFPRANSAIAREQSIVKVSVYTLQFMFIKIKWETRERRRWEEGEAEGRTHKTHTRAREECQEFVYQTCPVRDERGGGRTTNCAEDENEQIAHGVCKISC